MGELTRFVKGWLCPSHLSHSEYMIFKMSLLINHNDDFAILLMYKTQSQRKSLPLIISLYMFFCIWFVLPFLGHHLCAVLFFNSIDKVASFGFLVGTISSGVCMCVCVFLPAYSLSSLLHSSSTEFVYITFLLLGTSSFW